MVAFCYYSMKEIHSEKCLLVIPVRPPFSGAKDKTFTEDCLCDGRTLLHVHIASSWKNEKIKKLSVCLSQPCQASIWVCRNNWAVGLFPSFQALHCSCVLCLCMLVPLRDVCSCVSAQLRVGEHQHLWVGTLMCFGEGYGCNLSLSS